MQILQFSGQTAVADIVAKAYNLKQTDPQMATATKNFIAANPAFGGNLAAVPKGTIMVVPPLNGNLHSAGATTVDPVSSAFRMRLTNLTANASLAAAARDTPNAPTAPLGAAPGATTPTSALAKLDFTVLQQDLAAFAKLHGVNPT
jgi:hypothetical protein